MERDYALTEEDLVQVQVQILAAWRERLRADPFWFARVVALAGVLLWPLAAALFRQPVFALPPAGMGVRYLLMLGLAGGVVYVLKRRLPTSARMSAWTARRMGQRAAQASVLGPIHLALDAQGLTRTNSAGAWRVERGEVAAILQSAWGITVRVAGQGRVIPIPSRAHPDVAAEAAFLSTLQALRRPEPERARPAVRRELWVALGFVLLLLGTQRGLTWFHDPRRSNPAGQVVMYSTQWCPVCARLRSCLHRHQVPFVERDVERSPKAEAEWEALNGTGVPVTLIGQEVLVGLDPDALHQALAGAGFDVRCD